MSQAPTGEDAKLGAVSTTALVAASMIGAGVYTTSGFTIADLGSPWWVLLAWFIGGVIALCGASVYAALATQFTESGGEYLLLSRAMHPAAGLMAGWVSLLAGFTGAMAFAALAFASYALPLVENVPAIDSANGLAIALVLVATALNLVQLNAVDLVQKLVVATKLLLIIGLVVWAVGKFPSGWAGLQSSEPLTVPTPISFATALMWISLSYCGFNAAIYMAGEVRQPHRNVPIGIVAGTLLVTTVYLVLNAIFVLVPERSAISGQGDVAAIAAEALGGAGLVSAVRMIIALSLASSVLAMSMAGPRVYAKMAQDRCLPRIFHDRGRPTRAALLLQGLLAIVAILASQLQTLLSYLSFTLTISSAATCCLIFFPGQKLAANRLPLYPLTPIIFIAATAVTATLAALRRPEEALAALGTILVGGIAYRFSPGKPFENR